MFVVKSEHSYDWPVKVKVPVDGKHETQVFTATFKVLPAERASEIVSGGAQAIDIALMKEAVVGWKDVGAEAGGALAFGPDSLDALLAIPYVRIAVITAYYESLLGERWREKN